MIDYLIGKDKMKLHNPLVVFDLETTGTWIDKDKIIEIAMVKCHPDGRREIYDKRVNPEIPIPKFISELTGITDEAVKSAPIFKNIAKEILDFIAKNDVAGFNIARFDLPLLARELNEAGYPFDWKQLKIYDVQRVYHLNEKRDLNAAYQFYCSKILDNAHSAIADTQATLEILQSQLKKYGTDELTLQALDKFEYKKTADFFDEEQKFRWWNGKLYVMFGKYAKRYSLQELVQKDRAYLEWILSASFSDEVKELVQNALNGQFPVFRNENL